MQLVTDHSMKPFISEIMSALLNEATHSVAVPTGKRQVNEFNKKFIKTCRRGVSLTSGRVTQFCVN